MTVYDSLPFYWYFIKQETYQNCDKSLWLGIFEELCYICTFAVARVAHSSCGMVPLVRSWVLGLFLWGLLCTQNNVWKSQSVNINVSESHGSLQRNSALNVGQEPSLLTQRSKSSDACKEHCVVLCVWCFLVCVVVVFSNHHHQQQTRTTKTHDKIKLHVFPVTIYCWNTLIHCQFKIINIATFKINILKCIHTTKFEIFILILIWCNRNCLLLI